MYIPRGVRLHPPQLKLEQPTKLLPFLGTDIVRQRRSIIRQRALINFLMGQFQ